MDRFRLIFRRFAVDGSKKCPEFRPANKNFKASVPLCRKLQLEEGVKPRTDREHGYLNDRDPSWGFGPAP